MAQTSNAGRRRLMATVVDELARSDSNHRFGVIPTNEGFRDLTFGQLASAVDAFARWIEEKIGKAENHETVAYMGRNDILYLVFILACNKTGHKTLLPSTRLSDEAYKHILGATGCRMLFYSSDKERMIAGMKKYLPGVSFCEVPATAEVLEAISETYPFTKTFEEVEDEVSCIIHSSGTTGMPKPVPLTHGFVATLGSATCLPLPSGRAAASPRPGEVVLGTTPFFHLMGLYGLTSAIFHGSPLVNLPDKPVSVDLIIDTIRSTKPTAATLTPSVIEDMSQVQAGLDSLSTLDAVYFAGAPLAAEVGHKVSEYTKVVSFLGSSEMGIIGSMVPEDKEDWLYFEWNPAYGVEMQHRGEGLYELVIPRRENSRAHQGIFHTFPERTEYGSKDLFVPHPSRPHLWKYHGRFDDVIVLSNGEKLNPVTLEKTVACHPRICRAVLIGQARFQTSLLVEPYWDMQGKVDEAKFIDEIWPVVERANDTVPNYGRISKSMIRLSSPEKPFKVTPKGTTQRQAVNKEYKSEIDEIYDTAEMQLDHALPESITRENLTNYVNDVVRSLLGLEHIANDEDLYSAGLDSLQTIQLATILRSAVSFQAVQGRPQVTAQHIYAHSTVSQLAEFILNLITGKSQASVPRNERITNTVTKYTSDIPTRPTPSPQLPSASTVILTGSTGSLGTYLLHTLVTNPQVAKIYCFNRSDAQDRQVRSFSEKGLDPLPLTDPSKVEFLTVSFGAPRFNLTEQKYNELLEQVDTIIHNAWKVNFNHPLESFEDPHIRGVHDFVTFSLQSKYNAHLSFVSSVSTIGAWTAEMGPVVPEIPFENADAVMTQGYGESKHVAERICLAASQKAHVPTTVFRVGQVSGPTTESGLWNRDEWLPTIVATSKTLGKVPETLGSSVVDWVPVDTLAQVILDLLLTRRSNLHAPTHAIHHLMNPHHAPWSSLIPPIEAEYQTKTVSFDEWISDLEKIKNPSDSEVRAMPALKLLDFYRGLNDEGMLSASISVQKSLEGGEAMRGLGPITAELMDKWIKQWKF
ncbi:hypothetical protein BDV25DRAFT_170593 [Aspergillus avenaceus]|uniref:Carrier domain-containing protein n=1 Tax=Aspergillus avenaceus TaxID=36643 RepID=A0A5N6U0Z9_ASPAV|nr:hypothetical protein BDV25DRAFT_170593 [Aspergillus avenaceus]